MALSKEDSDEKERARLYEGAALIATDDFERGVEILSAIERSKLDEPEHKLLDAALSIAGQIRRMPAAPGADSEPPSDQAQGAGAGQVLERAQKMLAQVDQLLSEQTK